MLNDLLERVTEYVTKAREAKAVYESTVKQNHLTYKEGATCDKMDETAKSEFMEKIKNLFALVSGLPKELDQVKATLDKIITDPIPESVSRLMDEYATFGNELSERDLEVLKLNTEHNYLATRVFEVKFNQPRIVTRQFDNVVKTVDKFRSVLNERIIKPYRNGEAPNTDNYDLRVLMYEEETNRLVDEINWFCNRFSM